MNIVVKLVLSMILALSAAAVILVEDEKGGDSTKHKKMSKEEKKEPVMRIQENVRVVLDIFSAIERRDERRLLELIHPELEIHWPPSLPYGGTSRTHKHKGPTWEATWFPLQPTEAERRMDPRVVAASEDEVVVLWRQRGVTPTGDRFDGEVLGLYQIRGEKLARAQMFYFDTAALVSFLAKVK
jgi:ketosteroid isomerase-like protein